jgi:hypothetical protein
MHVEKIIVFVFGKIYSDSGDLSFAEFIIRGEFSILFGIAASVELY